MFNRDVQGKILRRVAATKTRYSEISYFAFTVDADFI